MGFRTVLALNNDMAHQWDKDPELGRKIWEASSRWSDQRHHYQFKYGEIIEQVHADDQSLIIAEHYGAKVVTRTGWHRGQTTEERDLALLKSMADMMGYRVVKKPQKKD